MTDTNTQTTASKKPSHIAYQVRKGKGDKSFWTRIGATWMHEDNDGFTTQLDAIPLDGQIVHRIATEKKE